MILKTNILENFQFSVFNNDNFRERFTCQLQTAPANGNWPGMNQAERKEVYDNLVKEKVLKNTVDSLDKLKNDVANTLKQEAGLVTDKSITDQIKDKNFEKSVDGAGKYYVANFIKEFLETKLPNGRTNPEVVKKLMFVALHNLADSSRGKNIDLVQDGQMMKIENGKLWIGDSGGGNYEDYGLLFLDVVKQPQEEEKEKAELILEENKEKKLLEHFYQVIENQYNENILMVIDNLNLNSAEKEEIKRTAKIAYDDAFDAVSKLSTMPFENYEDKEYLLNKFIDLLGKNNLNIQHSPDSARNQIILLQTIGFSVDKAEDVYLDTFGDPNETYSSEDVKKWGKDIENYLTEVRRVFNLKENLEDWYDIKMTYNNIPQTRGNYSFEACDFKCFRRSIIEMSDFLLKYPPFLIEKSGLKEMVFVEDIQPVAGGQSARAFQDNEKIFFEEGAAAVFFHHELLHVLDQSDDYFADDVAWSKLNKNGYTGKTNSPVIDGFASGYGRKNALEDQATILQYLINEHGIKKFLKRCESDEALRKKVQMMTGCLYKTVGGKWKFVDTSPSRIFPSGKREYFSKWSTDQSGRVLMNAKYWNMLAEGKKIKWEKKSDGKFYLLDDGTLKNVNNLNYAPTFGDPMNNKALGLEDNP